MTSKKNLCQNWKLYAITDEKSLKGISLEQCVREILLAGVSAVQLRDKTAHDDDLVQKAQILLPLCRSKQIPLIVNDRVQVALRSDADGLHLGQEDLSLDQAKGILGNSKIYGRSTHSIEQALAAKEEGFDYIGVGPVFATPTKPDYQEVGLGLVRTVSKVMDLPFVAIGGIDASNIQSVMAHGAKTVAVVRALMASQNPGQSARHLLGYFT